MATPIITLTTDFGLRDPYVAEMKAVMLSICPEITIVDVSHEIEKFNIRMAAFVLACAAPYFPKGTIHVAVVDPGVGTRRKPIVIQTQNAYYLGPDNGILVLATRNDKPIRIREITNRRLIMPRISDTFHGRDLFAPMAAHMAKGTRFEETGKRLNVIVEPSYARVVRRKNAWIGEAIHVDDFGNVITNLERADFGQLPERSCLHIRLESRELKVKLCRTYSDVERNEPLATFGSHGFLEISASRGSAAELLRIRSGDKLIFRYS